MTRQGAAAAGRRWRRRPVTDADLARRHFSPQCLFCAHLDPDGGRYCAAYPAGGPEIPASIFAGDELHLTPRGDEARDEQGRPSVFHLHSEVLPAALAAANPDLAAALRERPTQ